VMKITAVRSFLLSYPLHEPRRLPFYGGECTIVVADNGLVGYTPGPGSEIAHRIIKKIRPFLEVTGCCQRLLAWEWRLTNP
jgi:hypothetical protein